MRAASNSLMRSMLRSSPSDLCKRPVTSDRCPPNTAAADSGRALRNCFARLSGDIQRIVSRLSKALACPIAVSGKSRFSSCCGASWTAAEYRNRFVSIPRDIMLRRNQVEKLALGLCLVIVYALLWIPQAMSAAKVTTPSGLQYMDLTVGNGDVAKAGDQVSVHYTGWLQKPDGSKGQKFDSSKDRGQPFQFALEKVRSSKVGMKGY
jgi:FKBP-type peptidyl-prolyl cis-trans isomerase